VLATYLIRGSDEVSSQHNSPHAGAPPTGGQTDAARADRGRAPPRAHAGAGRRRAPPGRASLPLGGGTRPHPPGAPRRHPIRINHKCIPNYGEWYRSGETISTAFVESAVNQVMSKRMAKKQQMRWTRCGAHHMLQVRTQVLDGELRRTFCRWYPGMAPEAANEMAVAA